MAEHTYWTCDLCGKETYDCAFNECIELFYGGSRNSTVYELCPDCMESVERFLKGFKTLKSE